MVDQLPSFFVVGAQKAGTSSLHDWLEQLPGVCLPKHKETDFFTFQKLYDRGLNWYLQQFPDCTEQAVIGEVSPNYMFFPEACRRIREHIPNAKFIFIFRHPIDRAYSNYLMDFHKGYETLSFQEALLKERARWVDEENLRGHWGYIMRGRYAAQVKRFQQVFPESEFMFIKFEDLIAPGEVGASTFEDICRFIGLQPPFLAVSRGVSNPAQKPRFVWLRDFIHGSSRVKSTMAKFIPDYDMKIRLWKLMDRINSRPLCKTGMGSIPMSVIMDVEQEIEQLERLTGMQLDDWHMRSNEYMQHALDK